MKPKYSFLEMVLYFFLALISGYIAYSGYESEVVLSRRGSISKMENAEGYFFNMALWLLIFVFCIYLLISTFIKKVCRAQGRDDV